MAAADAPPAARSPGSGGGNLLTRKIGPLPTWGWLAIITVAGLVFYLYEKRKTAAAAATTAAGTTATSTAASNVPDYVFQNYNELPQTTTAPQPPPTAPATPATPASPAPVTTAGPPTGVGNTATQISQDTAWYLAHLSPAQRQIIATQPSSAWSSIPGIAQYANALAHLSPAARATLTQPSSKWNVAGGVTSTAPAGYVA